jgi:hypothetical protein
MADTKISALTSATLPLSGTEVLPIVQGGVTVKVANNNLRPTQIQSNATSGVLQIAGPAAAATRVMTTPDANFTAARIDAAQSFTGDQTLATGNLIIGTSGKGIDFSATPGTGTSELLADYEEGTWTPEFDSPGATFTYNAAQTGGIYTRVGRVVTLSAVISITAKSGGTTGNPLTFGNFPFSPNNADFGGAGPAFTITCFSYTITVPVGYEIWTAGVKNGNGILPLYASTLGAGFRMFEYGDISGTAQIQFSATYQTS